VKSAAGEKLHNQLLGVLNTHEELIAIARGTMAAEKIE